MNNHPKTSEPVTRFAAGDAQRPYDAVVWDFDGVIARTENLHIAAWHRAVSHVDIDMPRSIFQDAAVIDDRELIARAFASFNISLSASQIHDWCKAKQRILHQMIRSYPPLYPGVEQVINRLHQLGITQGVVTNTWRDNVLNTLAPSELHRLMDFIIAKEDVVKPKPSAEGYQMALRKLGIPGLRCVALEDSNTGLIAAQTAGLSTLAVIHPHSPAQRRQGNWSLGSPLVTDITTIPELIQYRKTGS